MLIGTVGGGFLGQIDLAIPFLLRSALLVALLVLAFFGMHDIGFQPRPVTIRTLPAEATTVAKSGVRHGWGSRPLRLIMIAGAIQSGFFFWAWYAWQPYFLELLDRDLVWVGGVVSALLALSMIAGNQVVDVLSRRCGFRSTLLLWSAAVFSLAGVVVGVASSFWIALPALCLMMAAIGVTSPTRQAFLHETVPSAQRATVVSFDSLIAGVGGTAAQPALGAVAADQGYGPGFVVGSLTPARARRSLRRRPLCGRAGPDAARRAAHRQHRPQGRHGRIPLRSSAGRTERSSNSLSFQGPPPARSPDSRGPRPRTTRW
jgi:hypothetical protein